MVQSLKDFYQQIKEFQQPILAATIVSLGKFLGSKVQQLNLQQINLEYLSFLNLQGSYKNLAGSAVAISGAFKTIDWVTEKLMDHAPTPLAERQVGIRTTLAAIGGYTAAHILVKNGFLPQEYKIPFLALSTVIYLFTDGADAGRAGQDQQLLEKIAQNKANKENIDKRVKEYVNLRVETEGNNVDITDRVNKVIDEKVNEKIANSNKKIKELANTKIEGLAEKTVNSQEGLKLKDDRVKQLIEEKAQKEAKKKKSSSPKEQKIESENPINDGSGKRESITPDKNQNKDEINPNKPLPTPIPKNIDKTGTLTRDSTEANRPTTSVLQKSQSSSFLSLTFGKNKDSTSPDNTDKKDKKSKKNKKEKKSPENI